MTHFQLTCSCFGYCGRSWARFDPGNVMAISTESYMRWFLYCQEYKMLVLDHLSDLAEQRAVAAAAAAASSSPSSSSGQDGALLEPGWGSACVRRLCVIRDLKGFQVSERLEKEKKVQFI
jgi:hypothetical protein